MKLLLTPQAREDLEATRDPLFSRIAHRLEFLESYPHSGAEMHGPWSGYRSFVVGCYRIVYRIASSDVLYIAYIRVCRRKPLT